MAPGACIGLRARTGDGVGGFVYVGGMTFDGLRELALVVPVALVVLVGGEAEACPGGGDPCAYADFWDSLAPINAGKIPADGVLVLQGAHHQGADADWLTKIDLTVTKDGQAVAGAFEATSLYGLLVWRPEAPWEPGASYTLGGELVNPDAETSYCGPLTIPLMGDLVIDAAPGAAIAAVEWSGAASTESVPQVTLANLVCCPGATPTLQYGGCGTDYVQFDPMTCAPTEAHGYLGVTITGQPAATGSVAAQVIYTLKVDGNVHSTAQTPDFMVYGDVPFCAVIEAEDLGSGAVTTSAEQCFGQDVIAELGPLALDPAAQLDCALEQCAVVNDAWDPMQCAPYDPEPQPTGSDSMSAGGSETEQSGSPEDGGEKGCACDVGPGGEAGLLGLLGLLGLVRRRRR